MEDDIIEKSRTTIPEDSEHLDRANTCAFIAPLARGDYFEVSNKTSLGYLVGFIGCPYILVV